MLKLYTNHAYLTNCQKIKYLFTYHHSLIQYQSWSLHVKAARERERERARGRDTEWKLVHFAVGQKQLFKSWHRRVRGWIRGDSGWRQPTPDWHMTRSRSGSHRLAAGQVVPRSDDISWWPGSASRRSRRHRTSPFPFPSRYRSVSGAWARWSPHQCTRGSSAEQTLAPPNPNTLADRHGFSNWNEAIFIYV